MAKNTTLQHKRSSVAGNKPTAAQVAKGELAINFADKSIYTQDGSGTIIELARDVIKAAAAPTSPTVGTVWYDTTNTSVKSWDGAKWVNVAFTGKDVLPANTTTAGTGSGTSGSPYSFTGSYASGSTNIVDTVTITGLAPGQYVPTVDLDAATNGGRYTVSNNIADDTGTLTFNIIFKDLPASANGTTYTASFKVGVNTVYIDVATTVAIPMQAINTPTNTLAVTTAWTDAATSLTATGDILISLDGVTFGAGPLAITTGATLHTKWAGTAGSGTGIDGAHGTTITGVINGVSNHSLTIDKTVDAFTFTDVTGVATAAAQTSNTITLSGINSYVYLTSAQTMSASVAGGAFVSVPASGTTLSAINGQTVQVRHTSSASTGTLLDTALDISGVSDTFSSTTATAGIVTPTIVLPIAGGTLGGSSTSSAFSIVGSAETHLSSDWEVYSDAALTTLVTSSLNDTANKTSWVPTGLTSGSTYYIRTRHKSTSFTSSWSNAVNFTYTIPFSTLIYNGPYDSASGGSSYYDSVSGKFMVGLGYKEYMESTDGVTWTEVEDAQTGFYKAPTGVYIRGTGVNFAPSPANIGTIKYSTNNGATWSTSTLPNASIYYTGVYYSGGKYYVTGYDSANFTNVYYSTTDFTTYTVEAAVPVEKESKITQIGSDYYYMQSGVVYKTPNIFAAGTSVSDSDGVLISSNAIFRASDWSNDGVTWTPYTYSISNLATSPQFFTGTSDRSTNDVIIFNNAAHPTHMTTDMIPEIYHSDDKFATATSINLNAFDSTKFPASGCSIKEAEIVTVGSTKFIFGFTQKPFGGPGSAFLLKSTDAGATWTNVSLSGLPQGGATSSTYFGTNMASNSTNTVSTDGSSIVLEYFVTTPGSWPSPTTYASYLVTLS